MLSYTGWKALLPDSHTLSHSHTHRPQASENPLYIWQITATTPQHWVQIPPPTFALTLQAVLTPGISQLPARCPPGVWGPGA